MILVLIQGNALKKFYKETYVKLLIQKSDPISGDYYNTMENNHRQTKAEIKIFSKRF